jgi:hypothetical protein
MYVFIILYVNCYMMMSMLLFIDFLL